jgi:hypothetical protein
MATLVALVAAIVAMMHRPFVVLGGVVVKKGDRAARRGHGRFVATVGPGMDPADLFDRPESGNYAAFDGLETSVDSERFTRSTTWKRVIITVVKACGQSARSISTGVQVRPFVRFLTVMIASTS